MPNHVKNTLSFSGDPKKISEMKEKIKNDEYGLGTYHNRDSRTLGRRQDHADKPYGTFLGCEKR